MGRFVEVFFFTKTGIFEVLCTVIVHLMLFLVDKKDYKCKPHVEKKNIKTFTQLKACFFKNEQGLNFIIKKVIVL